MRFREDINGLRAWAVIAVLLFHFSLLDLPGGFAGVDIFFVISGYLMTAIIIRGYEKENFSIWIFYLSRIRRILPTLMAVIVVLLILGWFWLPTPDYQTLGAQSAYSLTFLSNIYYWNISGYFDSSAQEKWLLHTWSLSVEAQFYLFYPLFITLVRHLWKDIKAVSIAVSFLFFTSLTLSFTLFQWNPNSAFYLLPSRIWELSAGALVFIIARQYHPPEKISTSIHWLGWMMLIASFFLINETLDWPLYWAFLPVLGTSFIILANKENCQLSNNNIAQWLGNRSYSLYLWHWPLVVGLHFINMQNEWFLVLSFFFLSILLAHLSYQLVETPTRNHLSQLKPIQQIVMIGLFGLLLSISALSIRLFAFTDRIDNKIEMIAYEANNLNFIEDNCRAHEENIDFQKCIFGENNNIRAIVIGDSHSESMITSIGKVAETHNKGVLYRGKRGCPMILNYKYYGTDPAILKAFRTCDNFMKSGLEYFQTRPKKESLILINRTPVYIMGPSEPDKTHEREKAINSEYFQYNLNQIKEMACAIQKTRQVYLIRPIPEMNVNVPETLIRNLLFNKKNMDIRISLEQYHKRNEAIWKAQDQAAQQCGVKILNPLPYLCDDSFCYATKNDIPLYHDDNHLNAFGNELLMPMLEEVFK